jgi:hypothetical protein
MVMSFPRARLGLWLGLLLYSSALVGSELLVGPELARHLCTDIVGPIRLYAINTSLSVALLLGAALLLCFAAAVRSELPRAERRFLCLQAGVLCYLGLDDRFLLHESLGTLLRVDDAFVLLGVGVFELWLLWRYGALSRRSRRARRALAGAAAAFGVMTCLDAFLHDARGIPRLTLEDGAKVWCAACLFAFAWEVAAAAIAYPRVVARERAA